MMKRVLTAAVLAAVLAVPALAQTPASKTSETSGQAGFVQKAGASDWRGTKLIGASVYGPDNASIGEISDVLIASDGRIQGVVVGVGEKDVALPFSALTITPKSDSSSIDKIKVSYSKDLLKDAPIFAFNDTPTSQTTGSSVTDKLKSMSPTDGRSKK